MKKQTRIIHMPWMTYTVGLIRRFIQMVWQDRVSVYAAQASFFTVISAVPLLSLVVNVVKLILPQAAEREKILAFFTGAVPQSMLELAVSLFDEVAASSAVPVVSISAVIIWWSAAKGVGAVREGIQTVYEAPRVRGYLRKMFRSLAYTIVFAILITAVIAVLLFGEFLLNLLKSWLQLPLTLLDTILRYKTPLFLVLLTLVFTILYYAVARRSSVVTHRFLAHIPGALCAALGWIAFSWAYSFYMTNASRPHMLYGELTGLCLMMLWLYFCMIILLCGAEINKMFFARARQS